MGRAADRSVPIEGGGEHDLDASAAQSTLSPDEPQLTRPLPNQQPGDDKCSVT